MASLLEKYSKRISLGEQLYKEQHQGQAMDDTRKLVLASCLENINKKLVESSATQKAAFSNTNDGSASWGKFTLNLVNVAVPNLIAFDLCIVSPMKNMSGFVVYMEYLAGTNKGDVSDNDLINGVFGLGDVNKLADYTSQTVVQNIAIPATGAADVQVNFIGVNMKVEDIKVDGESIIEEGVEYTIDEDGYILEDGEKYEPTADTKITVKYSYDNVHIPQKELPEIKAQLKSITLQAKTRRIAINYAQIAQFQAQTEYGLDIGKALAEQAVSTLQFEIDTEIVNGLKEAAKGNEGKSRDGVTDKRFADFDLHLPVGVSMQDHFASFANRIDLANEIIYELTKKFTCTYLIGGASLLKVLRFCPNWKPANVGTINGPYLAGTLEIIKVFITPSYKDEYVFGVNGSDLMTSAAVYAPYMPIAPTALLGLPDGSIKQGFSTCYDFKIVNPDLLIYGRLKGTMFGA